LPALVSGQELESIKGSTVNRSNTTGGSSSLTVGSSTTFGASANLNASPGTKSSSSSSLKLNALGADANGTQGLQESCPTGGCLRTSVGGENSTLTGNIVNLKATDATQYNSNEISSTSNTLGAGDVDFTGISGSNNLVLDPSSQFVAETETLDALDSGENTRVSSAAASSTIDTSTNADIKSTSFTSVFQQAF
tara:strand:- start:852 stop:1433 length:582 start_codon:yes stop_codon:yes gene_type:complete